ncbi:hypothetical protein ACLIT5_004222 [Citrobacter koseri]
MDSNIIELVKLGHERAAELKGSFEAINACSVAQLISDLASQLEVQLVRSNALAAKLSMINGLMEAAEQANKLAQEATEKLVQERDALAAENAALKDINAWCKTDAFKNMYREFKTAEALGCPGVDCMHDAMLAAIMHAPETPATSAFLAEVRAQGVESYAEQLNSEAERANETGWDGAAKFLRSELEKVREFAAQLRQGGAA